MINICTLSDSKFLLKGLALYQSLINSGNEFTLHYLCIDNESSNILISLGLKNLIAYDLEYFEYNDDKLLKCRNNPPSEFAANKEEQFIWALAPYFTNYILKKLPENEYLFYIDADICIYENLSQLLQIIGYKSVGIHSHKFNSAYNDNYRTGWFNVGIVIFKNNLFGQLISTFWKNLLLDSNNSYYEKYGTCGDQKYLELFPKIWSLQTCIFDNDIEHLAPWNWNRIITKNIFFFHFSDFETSHYPETIKPYKIEYQKLLDNSKKLLQWE